MDCVLREVIFDKKSYYTSNYRENISIKLSHAIYLPNNCSNKQAVCRTGLKLTHFVFPSKLFLPIADANVFVFLVGVCLHSKADILVDSRDLGIRDDGKKVTCTITNPSGTKTENFITPLSDGTYKISYTPFEEGK